ncbi:MAG: CBS domain-containing protein [Methanomassiliicoccus sp.]|nr:CBS domain-containing protein [Methanomassiliicoccus sp.]
MVIMELSEIRKLRQKAGISQTELARKAGVSQAHIAKIESGKVDPRFSTVERIMRCLKEEEKDHCSKYMTETIFGVQADDTVSTAAGIMSARGVSQLIVFRGEAIVGLLTEEDLLRFKGDPQITPASEVMSDPPPTVSKNTSSDTVKELLLEFPAVVVVDQDRAAGILTKSDLIKR